MSQSLPESLVVADHHVDEQPTAAVDQREDPGHRNGHRRAYRHEYRSTQTPPHHRRQVSPDDCRAGAPLLGFVTGPPYMGPYAARVPHAEGVPNASWLQL